MEPSDKDFARTFHFLDEHGDPLPVSSSIGETSSVGGSSKGLGASFKPPRNLSGSMRHRKSLSSSKEGGSTFQPMQSHRHVKTASAYSMFSDNTLVQSVLMAEGMMDAEDDEALQEMPLPYVKGNVKAKITWFGCICLAGVGMFVEAYVIITTGQVKTVWHNGYPECWDSTSDQVCPDKIVCCGLFPNTPEEVCSTTTPNEICTDQNTYPDGLTCSESQLVAVSYAEFAGIMAGMVSFGWIADQVGRKNAATLTSILMIIGLGFMTYFDSSNVSTLFLVFSIFFGLFGLGVGGEYPLTATQASERSAQSAEDALWDDEEKRQHRLLLEKAKTDRRGETISLVFAMQGVGAVVGSLFLLSFIYFSDQTRADCSKTGVTSNGNDSSALESVWRNFYFVGLIFVLMLFVYRFLVLEEGEGYNTVLARRFRREAKYGKTVTKNLRKKAFEFYLPRLVGTGGNWFIANMPFYGLKLYSGPIFEDINPGGALIVQNGYLLLSNICALAGYYVAAILIDRHSIGRKKIQMFSFGMSALLFMLTAGVFNSAPTGAIIFLYFATNFIGQGVNVTTYVIAAEMYPTELRGTFHGLSAFLGKLGALSSTIIFGYLTTEQIFWVCGGCSIVGGFCTYLFTADLSRVSLAEHDAQLELFLAGRLDRYQGKLNHRDHLSNFELWTGRHGKYDPGWVHKLVRDERKKTAHPDTSSAAIESNVT
jgi:MFS family permease